jgi:hypothetical protein
MRRIPHPTPSMLVALLALVLAVGGSAFAAGVAINGNLLKKGSVAGDRLKNDTLTGTQIKESKLGKVPSAASADRAGTANSATHALTAGSAATAGSATSAGHATTADGSGKHAV